MNEEKGKNSMSGLVFIGCIFIGGGIGLAFGNLELVEQ